MGLSTGQSVGETALDLGHAGNGLQGGRLDLGLVSDDADDRAIGAAAEVSPQAERFDPFDDMGDLLFGDLGFQDDNHVETAVRTKVGARGNSPVYKGRRWISPPRGEIFRGGEGTRSPGSEEVGRDGEWSGVELIWMNCIGLPSRPVLRGEGLGMRGMPSVRASATRI